MRKTKEKEYFSVKYYFYGSGDENKILEALNAYTQNNSDSFDVNQILELYNIKIFFEKYECMEGWGEEQYNKYKNLTLGIMKEVQAFFDTITEYNLVSIYDECVIEFKDDFWHFFYVFKLYERIYKEKFVEIMTSMHISPKKLLSNKKFVEKFDYEITRMLKQSDYDGAKFIIQFYLLLDFDRKRYYLPKSLTSSDKYDLVRAYIEGDRVDANDLQLIINARTPDYKQFPIDAKLRYLAKKRYERLWKENTMPVITTDMGISVSFDVENPDESLELIKGKIMAKYNSNWIKDNLDYPTLLNNFIYLFHYVDLQMRCSLTVATLKRDQIEELASTNGNGMYKCGRTFNITNDLANAQMACYLKVLKNFDVYLEDIIKWFFETYLVEEFSVKGFVCLMPKHTDSILSKYERCASVMDGIAKQFKLYCEEGEIDRELYEVSSESIRFRDIPSLIKDKYAYSNSKELDREINAVFSEQNMLSYTERTKGIYHTFYDLICNEEVNYNEVMKYNLDTIEWLKSRGTIFIQNGIIKFNTERIDILRQLYDMGVICLQYINHSTIKELIREEELVIENRLLSKMESEYFDYNLNKAQFSNGLDLRNKYIHDTGPLDENEQTRDYVILLKLMIILVIKINEEFELRTA